MGLDCVGCGSILTIWNSICNPGRRSAPSLDEIGGSVVYDFMEYNESFAWAPPRQDALACG